MPSSRLASTCSADTDWRSITLGPQIVGTGVAVSNAACESLVPRIQKHWSSYCGFVDRVGVRLPRAACVEGRCRTPGQPRIEVKEIWGE